MANATVLINVIITNYVLSAFHIHTPLVKFNRICQHVFIIASESSRTSVFSFSTRRTAPFILHFTVYSIHLTKFTGNSTIQTCFQTYIHRYLQIEIQEHRYFYRHTQLMVITVSLLFSNIIVAGLKINWCNQK